MLRVLVAVLALVAPLLLVGEASGQFGQPRLAAREGVCYRIFRSGGDEQYYECDRLTQAELDELGDDAWTDFCRQQAQSLEPQQRLRYCNRILQRLAAERLRCDGVLYGESSTYCAPRKEIDLGALLVTDLSIALDSRMLAFAPQERGFFATEIGPILVNPAFVRELKYGGMSAGMRFEDKMFMGDFGPIEMRTSFEVGSFSARSTTSGEIFSDGFGFPSVGNEPGVFIGYETRVESFDFSSKRSFMGLETEFGIPLATFAEEDTYEARLSLGVGGRLGGFDQVELTEIQTSSPAYSPDDQTNAEYHTEIRDFFAGLIAGIRIDSEFALGPMAGEDDFDEDAPVLRGPQPAEGGDLRLRVAAGAYVGVDQHSIGVTDSIDAVGLGGLLDHQSSKDLSYSQALMTSKLEAELGLGTNIWEVYVKGAIRRGFNPEIDYLRIDSDSSGAVDPELTLAPGTEYALGFGARWRF